MLTGKRARYQQTAEHEHAGFSGKGFPLLACVDTVIPGSMRVAGREKERRKEISIDLQEVRAPSAVLQADLSRINVASNADTADKKHHHSQQVDHNNEDGIGFHKPEFPLNPG